MLENLTEQELTQLQKDSPELAAKMIGSMLDNIKRDNTITKVEKQPVINGSRYGKSTNAPYYNNASGLKATKVLSQFVEDKENDLLVPYKLVGLSRASAKVFYTQAIHYILDNVLEFDDKIVDIAKHVKHKTADTGIRFTYMEDIGPAVMLRVPKEAVLPRAPGVPAVQPILNWRTQVEAFLDTATPGASITVSPVDLTDDEVQDFTEFLSSWGGLLFVVRQEKITVKKVSEVT
tara:strand:+ start:4625 stop:5326 length:702 start_codon:yes stop_codon:yes gene_type:complete